MTPQQLKNSILQYAIQGNLVEQRKEEGSAEELYQKIQEEKLKLIKEGKIKKGKALPEITEDEIPFDIPDSWKWVRLGEIVRLITDGTHKTPNYAQEGIPFISVQNISSGRFTFDKIKYISKTEHEILSKRVKPQKNDILFCRIGTLGKAIKIDFDMEFSIFVSLGLIRLVDININNFLLNYLNSPVINKWIDSVKVGGGTHTFKINLRDIPNMLVPLPPLEEQKRIVSKIEELLPLVEDYAKSYEELEKLNKKFPEDMKKSILQYAIQGKLVEQRKEEGTAEELYKKIQEEKEKLIKEGKIKKQKKLPEITEDEIPFDIPKSWKWVRFIDIMDVRDGTHDSPKYVKEGIPLITSKNLKNGIIDFKDVKYISQEDACRINMRSEVNNNDILFAMIGTIGNPVLVEKESEFCIKNMALFKKYTINDININYIFWFLFYTQYELSKQASGGVQSFVSLMLLRKYLVPLPPLEEQKRIVAKIEELLPLYEKLNIK